jgi:hypothetical protein
MMASLELSATAMLLHERKKRQMTVADSPLAATSMLETEKQQGVSLGTSVAHEFSKLHPSMVMILS